MSVIFRGLIATAAVTLALALAQGSPAQAAPRANPAHGGSRGHPALPAMVAHPGAPAATVRAAGPRAGDGDGCNPGRPNDFNTVRFDGWYRDPGSTVGGVYSDIYNYSPWVHYISSRESYVSAWTMVDYTGSPYDWAQVGWVEFPLGVRYTFDQTLGPSGGNPRTMYYGSQPVNNLTYYTTLYNNPSGYYGFYVNGKLIDKASILFTPNEGQNFGETHSAADQMPGGYDNTEDFFSTNIYYSGGWHNFAGTIADDNTSWYSYDEFNNANLSIWDNYCKD
jgi:hypothetical protein